MDDTEISLLGKRQTYKNFGWLLGVVLTAALGSLFFGYSLAYISSIPIEQTISNVGDNGWSNNTVKGVMSGIIPIGAGLGALSSSIFNQKFTRR